MATQNGVPFYQGSELRLAAKNLVSVFAHSGFYVVPVPTYAGGHMTLGWASQDTDLAASGGEGLAQAVDRLDLEARYYTAAIHRAAFALPGYIREIVAQDGAN